MGELEASSSCAFTPNNSPVHPTLSSPRLVNRSAHHLHLLPWFIVLIHFDTFDVMYNVQTADSSSEDSIISFYSLPRS